MSEVTWGDDSIRIRLFQTATRLSAHFYDAVAGTAGSGAGLPSKHLEDLNKRWLLLEGDQTVIEYERSLEKQLLPLAGEPVFDSHTDGTRENLCLRSETVGPQQEDVRRGPQVRCVLGWAQSEKAHQTAEDTAFALRIHRPGADAILFGKITKAHFGSGWLARIALARVHDS